MPLCFSKELGGNIVFDILSLKFFFPGAAKVLSSAFCVIFSVVINLKYAGGGRVDRSNNLNTFFLILHR